MTIAGFEAASRARGSPESAQESSPDHLALALSKNAEWASREDAVEWIQTHISHVFLYGDRVFKLRKAIRLPFLDFGSRDDRNADCLRELALNRRLAPNVYIGIAPILCDGSVAKLGEIAQTVKDPTKEHVVVMRRLPEGRDALSLLEAGRLEVCHLEAIASLLSQFHASVSLGRPAPWNPSEWSARIAKPVFESLTTLATSGLVEPSRLNRIESVARRKLSSLGPRFESRRLAGRAIDAHGDLHLDHIWFEEDDAKPTVIDCIEFDADLRHIDNASEVAFLAMDLYYRNRGDLAEWFLGAYAMYTDDYGLFPVVDVFASYRAVVRAKVAALAAGQPGIPEAQRAQARESVTKHLDLAETLLEERASPSIVLCCGTVGSGKSTVARHLAQSQRGIPISSDRVRKKLAGVPTSTHLVVGPDEGIYEASRTEDVYRALLERAGAVVASGRTAILDASFSRRSQRDLARSWARGQGLPIRLLEVRCRPETALARLRRRAETGTDPSDAGPEFLSISEQRFESPDEWPSSHRDVIWTD